MRNYIGVRGGSISHIWWDLPMAVVVVSYAHSDLIVHGIQDSNSWYISIEGGKSNSAIVKRQT